ncbi:hypothetical protein J5U18_13270 [Sphingobacteriaceae bacterium WQ 2009]|uniref:Core-binding (CB) domain-containing protein n=1 Tax=Rhinopithecimicrobium faecis TaxID=2820698 RepID=A0A8T4HGQ7_9SPHI|nr:hypothetical protein [Sphingobacteriaceae bacterium WQ 2009]
MRIEKNEFFIQWLVDNNITSRESAVSYDSYVRNAFSYIAKLQALDTNTIEEIINILSENGIAKNIKKSPKTILNYLSGLRAYGEFLNDTTEINGAIFPGENIEILTQLSSTEEQVYTYNTLYKNFAFRLITQDRFYDNIYFPISLIKQLFYKTNNKARFDRILKSMINSINIYLSEKDVILFEDISELKIKDKTVSVVCANNNLVIYTPTNTSRLEPFLVDKLSDVSIDHIIPQYTIMQELKDDLPEFKKLTEILKQSATKVSNRPTLAAYKNKFGLDSILQSIDLDQLENELRLVVRPKNLRLMNRSLNTSKGKK